MRWSLLTLASFAPTHHFVAYWSNKEPSNLREGMADGNAQSALGLSYRLSRPFLPLVLFFVD
jgi:hypothetical protein